MPKRELLSEAERRHLLGIPVDRDGLVKLYTLDEKDIDLIRLRREDRNRLGLAVQLALMRHPGMTMGQAVQQSMGIPEELLSFIAGQLDLPAEAIGNYASREQTMTDHARELAAAFGLRNAVSSDIPFLIEAAASAAWASDKGLAIAAGMIKALRDAKILMPLVSTMERAGIAGRARARKRAMLALVADLTPDQLAKLDLLIVCDPDKSREASISAGMTPLRPAGVCRRGPEAWRDGTPDPAGRDARLLKFRSCPERGLRVGRAVFCVRSPGPRGATLFGRLRAGPGA